MIMKKVVLFLILSTLSQIFLVFDVGAQTLTTRADRGIYSHFTVWGKNVNALGVETSNWQNYGYVKYDIEVSEPVPGKLHYRQLRMQPVPATNTDLSITQSACYLDNEGTRLKCYYTVKTTVKSPTTGIKQTSSYKGGGTAGVIASLPVGAEAKLEGSGEAASSTEQNITPTLSFSRSFEFAVQLRNSCTNNPGYSVYYQGQGSMPAFVPSQCTTPVPQGTKHCGGGTINRMANGVEDGRWVYESASPSTGVSLQHRTYRLYRSGPTDITVTNECHIGLSSRHVFEQYDWYWGNKRKNITYTRDQVGQGCGYTADLFAWDEMTRDYTRFIKRDLFGGGGCVDSSYPAKYKVITAPSTVVDY
jgi:hypothetical protein